MKTVYTKKNINLNFMSNYAKYRLTSNGLEFYNTLYNKEVCIKGDEKVLKELVMSLGKGVTNDDIYMILAKLTDKPDVLYEYLLQNFVIE